MLQRSNLCSCKLVPRHDGEYALVLCDHCKKEMDAAVFHCHAYGTSAINVVPGEGIKHVVLDSGIENAPTL